jgi:hypothetical protein
MGKPNKSGPNCLNINVMAYIVDIFPCYHVNGPDKVKFPFTVELISLSNLGTLSKFESSIKCPVIQKYVQGHKMCSDLMF